MGRFQEGQQRPAFGDAERRRPSAADVRAALVDILVRSPSEAPASPNAPRRPRLVVPAPHPARPDAAESLFRSYLEGGEPAIATEGELPGH